MNEEAAAVERGDAGPAESGGADGEVSESVPTTADTGTTAVEDGQAAAADTETEQASDTESADESGEETAGPSSLPTELVYRMLSDPRRRYAIHYLKQSNEPVAVRDLAEQVAAWENDKPVAALTSQERKRVYISLYQSHLPTMDEEGVVEYDADRKVVRLSPAARGLDIYLEVVPRGDVPWSLYYVGLAVVDAVLLLFASFDVAPFGSVPDIVWGVVVLVTFAASAFAQTYFTRRMRFGDPGPPPELGSGE